ncbi:MAG: hypothetical protein RL398_3503 [Planctomycetota bacterium]
MRDESVSFEFDYVDLPEQLADIAHSDPGACADRRGHSFVGNNVRLQLPAVAPQAQAGERVVAYSARLAESPEPTSQRHLLLLLRAGAAAIGYWDGPQLVDHKALRSYVVRGNGKAQPTHLESRGKSRYGSRLRLQNWRKLLRDVGERLGECVDRFGEPERIFAAMPVRVASYLWECEVPPPFARDDERLRRVAVHVHRPDFVELQRVHRLLWRGRLVRSMPPR